MLNGKTRRRSTALALAMALVVLLLHPGVGGTAWAYDINDTFAINGLLTSAGQCQEIASGAPLPTSCRGAVALQAEFLYNPTKQDQFYARLGFAHWNALNGVSPFVLAPWAADLQADVTHINGSNRNNLLDAWYAHTFAFSADNRLQVTGGIIDSSIYIDQNAFANNEYEQFMNEAFVNSTIGIIPSFDWGGAAVWTLGPWTLSGVGMNITKNSEGYNYNWFAAELSYHSETPLGEGNYRLMYAGTSRAFLSPAPAPDPAEPTANLIQPSKQRRSALALSCDQEFNKVVGVFLRVGWQTQDAAVDYGAEYSGGFNFKGTGWGRERDTIGLAFAYLPGGNTDIARTSTFETYYRLAFNNHFAVSADVQYMQDQYRSGGNTAGWVYGLRATAAF